MSGILAEGGGSKLDADSGSIFNAD